MRVRHAAVMALGRIGSPGAIDAIIASLGFCDRTTAHQAAFVLRSTTSDARSLRL